MIQEEAINQWIATMDEKKKQILERDQKIKSLQSELDLLSLKNRGQSEEGEGKVNRLEKLVKDLHDEKHQLQNQLSKLKQDSEAASLTHRQSMQDQLNERDRTIAELNTQMSELRESKQRELDRHMKQAAEDRAQWERERKTLEVQVQQITAEFDKYKEQRRLEDLMTVKLDVPQIDKDLLSKKETLIEDLEKEKAKLEAKVLDLSS